MMTSTTDISPILPEDSPEPSAALPSLPDRLPVVSARDLGKSYWLYPTTFRRIMGCFIEPKRVGATPLTALSGLTFDVYPGEALALIGKNGAGKSTALQILAGILQPSQGEYTVNGRLSALLELGSGFNPEFTGRDNIAIAGALAGLTAGEVASQEDFIVDFADIGQYIDQPVKYYSSGMFLRLAFAVAIAGKPDLLIVDEALAVGDIFFRQKCYARLREMRENGMAVLLVTHSSGDAQEFCDKAILLERGRQVYSGDPKQAMLLYYFSEQGITSDSLNKTRHEIKEIAANTTEEADDSPWPHLSPHFMPVTMEKQNCATRARLEAYCLTDENDIPSSTFIQRKTIRVYAKHRVETPVPIPATSVTIWNTSGLAIYSTGTTVMDLEPIPIYEVPTIIYSCQEIQLNIAPGEYTLSHGLSSVDPECFKKREFNGFEDWKSLYVVGVETLASFSVVLPLSDTPSRIVNFGLVHLPTKAQLIAKPTRN